MAIFFPVGSKRTFLPRQPQSSAGGEQEQSPTSSSHPSTRPTRDITRTSSVGEDRILIELRDMRRQIQASCAEEIGNQMQRLLQEIKRELQNSGERSKGNSEMVTMEDFLMQNKFISSAEAVQTGERCRQAAMNCSQNSLVNEKEKDDALEKKRKRPRASFGPIPIQTEMMRNSWSDKDPLPPSPPQPMLQQKKNEKGFKPAFLRSGSTVSPQGMEADGRPAYLKDQGDLKPSLPGMLPASPSADARNPPTDVPPMLPVEGELPPAPPVTDRVRRGSQDSRHPGLGHAVSFCHNVDCVSNSGRDSNNGDLDSVAAKAESRKLSLSVDVCRRKAKEKQQTKPIWKMSLADVLNSTKFDNLIGFLILLNALTIGIQTEYASTNLTEDFPETFQVIERIFLICFSLELLLRIWVLKHKFFADCESKNLIWNYFDFTIVVTQVLEEVLLLVRGSPSPSETNNGDGGSAVDADQFRLLRILRILRIVRILRVVRVLHLISELRTIVSSILGSFKSLGWTVVLLLLMIYIVSIFFTQTVSDHFIQYGYTTDSTSKPWLAKDVELQYFFGSLTRTILSLFQAISGGADWDSLAGPLIGQVSVLSGILFAAYIAFALLALMNVVTGVFVQTALQSAKDEEDAFLVDQVLKLFDRAGDDDTATITLDQIETRMTDPDLATEWKSINVQPAEAQHLFSLLDIEEKGEISFQEFLCGCLRLHGPSKSMDVLTVMQEARSAVRAWRLSNKRMDEFQFNVQTMLEGVANAVAACTNMSARLSCGVESCIEVANQNQDRIARLEKRIRAFEATLCSVRIAASNMNKVNEFIDTLSGPSIPVAQNSDKANDAGGEPANTTSLNVVNPVDEV